MALKQNVAAPLPIRLTLDGNGVPNITYDQVTMYLTKNGGAQAARTVLVGEWTQVSATNQPGLYWFSALSGDLNTNGWLSVYVTMSGCDPFAGMFWVEVDSATAITQLGTDVAAVKTDTGNIYARLGAPAGASFSADIAAAKADTANIYARQGAPIGASQSADTAAIKADTVAIFARQGAPAGASQSADVAAVKAKTDNLPSSPAATGAAMTLTSGERTTMQALILSDATPLAGANVAAIKTDTGNIYARQGAPAGASQSADLAAVKTDTGNIYARQGAPTGASQSADAAAIAAAVAAVSAKVDESQGLLLKNATVHQLTSDADGNMLTGAIYVYDSAAHATSDDGVTGLLKTYPITGTFADGHPVVHKMVSP